MNVSIVGGGAAGLLAAMHLLPQQPADLRITVVEKSPGVAEGIAYATRRPEHLLNVVASRMSAFDDDPEHFVRYLQRGSVAQGRGKLGGVFAERRIFSAYLRDSFQESSAGLRAAVVHDEAVALHDDEGSLALTLRSCQSVPSDVVVLPLGNWPRTTFGGMVTNAPRRSLWAPIRRSWRARRQRRRCSTK